MAVREVALLFLVACGSAGDGAPDAADDAAPDAEVASDGATACPTGQAFCGGACIDVTENDQSCGACNHACTGAQHCGAGACRDSNIEHVVLIVQENHTFDAYFGKYCQAPTGSNPTCTSGVACCERVPSTEPHGASPIVLDDSSNFGTDRDHAQACELQQIHGGKMDGYVTGSTGSEQCLGSGPSCASQNNFAVANITAVGPYWSLADNGALADRYFQPIAGGSSANNMYFAIAHYQFTDNDSVPEAIGTPSGCVQGICLTGTPTTYTGRTTIADLLLQAGKTFTVYADGFAHAASQAPSCESVPPDCTYNEILHPIAAQACKYDASDIPFAYYKQFADGPHIVDYSQLAKDVANKALPNFAYVKAREFHNEHPNVSTISDGIAFVKGAIQTIENSAYASSTLVLLTWDEGGGFFDHVSPPASIDTDDASKPVPYGTRVPMLAIGTFAKKGAISHVTMEHSSIVRFLEYNFLGPVGQLRHNDAKVKNIGSMLDPTATAIHVPD